MTELNKMNMKVETKSRIIFHMGLQDGRAEVLKGRLEVLAENKAPSCEDISDLLRANIKSVPRLYLLAVDMTVYFLGDANS